MKALKISFLILISTLNFGLYEKLSGADIEDNAYSSIQKLDPFLPWLNTLKSQKITIGGRLQSYEVTEFELLGTLIGIDISALIATPAPTEIFNIKIGDFLGRRRCEVVSIQRDQLIVREMAPQKHGESRYAYQDVILKIKGDYASASKKSVVSEKSLLPGETNSTNLNAIGAPFAMPTGTKDGSASSVIPSYLDPTILSNPNTQNELFKVTDPINTPTLSGNAPTPSGYPPPAKEAGSAGNPK